MKSCKASVLGLSISLAFLVIMSGCATPIGVRPQSPSDSYMSNMSSPLSAGPPSNTTTIVLHRFDLVDLFEKDPASAIKTLHDKAIKDQRRDIVFALAELSYFYGDQLDNSLDSEKKNKAPEYFLLSAIYSYTAILDKRYDPVPNLLDHRVRRACDLYNYSLWRGFTINGDEGLEIKDGTRKLPFGQATISTNVSHFPWELDKIEKFEPVDKYSVYGLSVRNRFNGIGLPMVALKPSQESPVGSQVLPATAFLRIESNLENIETNDFKASLELYSSYDDVSVKVNDREIPLEIDTTTPVAYKLTDNSIWSFGTDLFLGKFQNVPNKLYKFQPYNPDRIPVVFVHGTFSSPVWWAEMINTLNGDPVLRKKYQFWYFFYNSSKLITNSAADLRSELIRNVKKYDPENKSKTLNQMVVIGHSQGGLLTKMTAIDSKDKLLKTVLKGDIDKLNASEDIKNIIKKNLVFDHLPFVKRTVFISTPHRGSFLSQSLVRTLVRKLINFPDTILKGTQEVYGILRDDVKRQWEGKIPTSVDAMSPDDPLLNAIADLPLAPGIKGNSIIAIKDDGDPKLGNDGVVEYKSAHLEGMESEFIARSSHSCQDKPSTIEEVRRILLKHLEENGTKP
ncbi:esterase/lipase family protein [Desulforegula conservatrix]|uniref:esterase/lipase family protein n=1 Tax=Desulforegula conservatrix TaxID=153026 RepID=UPI0012EBE538|nr:hypothetical protein [Desulforegula conservatrix]